MRWGEAKPHLARLLAEGRLDDDEPIVLKFPRKEARKRIRNTEARKRVCWVSTPENFSLWHQARSYVIDSVGGNPVIADKLAAEFLLKVPAETWRAIEKAGDSEA